jgi:hypothetical protein
VAASELFGQVDVPEHVAERAAFSFRKHRTYRARPARARKAGSASFSLAMTSSRRMATSYQIRALHSGSGVFTPVSELLRHLAVIYRFRARINFALLSMRSVKLSC